MHARSYFEEVERDLQSLASSGIRPGLARLARLLSLLGNPERSFPAVHVVGTNGKGSTAAAMASILRESGYRTALYTSPHLVSFKERLEINGGYAAPQKWYDAAARIKKIMNECVFFVEDKPTLFELITAAAFMIIAEEDTDIAVVEAGLGGRLDATNILKNVVLTLITPIGMDHMEYLGGTIRSIAYEKFSVMRKNTPALFADKDAELGGYFMEMASKARACGHLMSDMCLISNVTTSLDGTVFSLQTQDGERCYTTPLTGLYQAENAALAIMGAQMIKDGFGKISETAISEGIKKTSWRGRLEKIADNPVILVDGAHNSHAMKRLVETLVRINGNNSLSIVLAMMQDKDVKAALEILSPLDPLVYCTQVPLMERSMRAGDLCMLARECKLRTAGAWDDPVDALNAASQSASMVVCCGSLYLVGYIKAKTDENGRV